MHMAMHAIAIQTAVRMKIPLVLWGKNTWFEYGGKKESLKGEYMTNAWRKVYGVTHGTTSRNWVDKYLYLKALAPYSWTSENEKKKVCSQHAGNRFSELQKLT